jgi:hypothetical protein
MLGAQIFSQVLARIALTRSMTNPDNSATSSESIADT